MTTDAVPVAGTTRTTWFGFTSSGTCVLVPGTPTLEDALTAGRSCRTAGPPGMTTLTAALQTDES